MPSAWRNADHLVAVCLLTTAAKLHYSLNDRRLESLIQAACFVAVALSACEVQDLCHMAIHDPSAGCRRSAPSKLNFPTNLRL